MRWAFWRRGRSPAQAGPHPATTEPLRAATSPSPVRADPPDEDRRATPAFSGASPEPGGDDPLLPDGQDLAGLLSVAAADPALDAAGVRAGVLALVHAAIARDRPAAAQVLRQLDGRGQDRLVCAAALAALGGRLSTAADVPRGGAPAAVVAQGDTVAARAEPLLRALAPHAPRALVRRVVRSACGVREQDEDVRDAPPGDLVLVAAVLLAQTVLDGPGDAQALADELAELLPG